MIKYYSVYTYNDKNNKKKNDEKKYKTFDVIGKNVNEYIFHSEIGY